MSSPGSSTKPGHLYHEPAFPSDRAFQRGGNHDRLNLLLLHQDWVGKTVVDFGCSAGFFTLRLALQGAKTHGFDADHDHVSFARSQALLHGVAGASFHDHSPGNRYYHSELSPDVVLLLSVIPWLIKTEPDHETLLLELAKAPVAFVELMYEGDGRAGMEGIRNDWDARRWLERLWPVVVPVGSTVPPHNGGIPRTLWLCRHAPLPDASDLYDEEADETGSQSFVFMKDPHFVLKRERPRRKANVPAEMVALKALEEYQISPKVVRVSSGKDGDWMLITRLQGERFDRWIEADGPRKDEGMEVALELGDMLVVEFERINRALRTERVEHRDVRPENIWRGRDGRFYLIDFGWAKIVGVGPTAPDTLNPEFGGLTDGVSFLKVIKWAIERFQATRPELT